MGISAVAFDVHGTLVRWPDGRVSAPEIQEMLERYGVPISPAAWEAARQAVFVLDAPKREIHGYVDFLALQFARMEARVSLDLIESVAAKHEARDRMVLFPDALPAVRAAKDRGLATCAFTTLPRFMLGPEAGRLMPLLDHYFDCSAIGLAKGDRRFCERVTERLGVDPASILCVGDDPIGDCLVPARAGWKAVLLDRSGRYADRNAGQIATIRSLSELGAILKSV